VGLPQQKSMKVINTRLQWTTVVQFCSLMWLTASLQMHCSVVQLLTRYIMSTKYHHSTDYY